MKRAIASLAFLIPLVIVASAQDRPQAAQQDGPWQHLLGDLRPRQLGPTNMGGRIMDLAVYEKDPRIIYIASASGGLWKTENGGITTTPVFEKESTVSLGAVAVSQKDPNIVWVGTGEGSSRNSVAWGDGVYRSTDGGKTWQHMGLTETRHITRVIIDPRDNNTVYVGALGRLWGPNAERGVFKTTDGGRTWNKVHFIDDKTGVAELVMNPKNPNELVCAMWARVRNAWDFEAGGGNSSLWRSTNGGRTWQKVTQGLPTGPLGRIGLGYHATNPKLMVATVEYRMPETGSGGSGGAGGGGAAGGNRGGAGGGGGQGNQPGQSGTGVRMNGGGVYLSKDGGASWEQVNNLNPRPFYFSQPHMDPNDPNRIYVLGVSLHVSDDQGKTFRTSQINVHSDMHHLWINPQNTNHLVIATDGGVYISFDRGLKWMHVNNMPIGQFYGIHFDYRKPYWVYGGLQDNGSWGFPTQTQNGGPAYFHAMMTSGGDGFHAQADPNDWRWLYTESQGGFLQRLNQETGESRSIRPRPPQGEVYRFNWSTPIHLSPHNSSTIYFGGNKLFKSVNRGDNWEVISPDLTTNDPIKTGRKGQKSVTPEDTGAERHCTIITISESPMKAGLVWVGTDDGLVWNTPDNGKTWNNVTANIPDLPANTWCSRVMASKYAEGRVYATFDGHRNNDFKPYVYVSEDMGKTWTKLHNSLPDYDSVYVIEEGTQNPDLLLVGSEMGLRFSLDRGQTWSKFRTNFPTVAVHDAAIHPRDLDVVLGTHGRSIWLMDVSALEQLTKENLDKDVFVPRPQNVLLLGRVAGGWFEGDFLYTSPNTQPGTQISYYLKNAGTGDVKVTISDAGGTVTQDLTGTSKKGLNVVRWNGRLRGRLADPGDYRIVVTVGGKEYVSAVKVERATN